MSIIVVGKTHLEGKKIDQLIPDRSPLRRLRILGSLSPPDYKFLTFASFILRSKIKKVRKYVRSSSCLLL